MLRMPLDTDAEGMTVQFQCLCDSVGADSRYGQSLADLVCGLMVQAVYLNHFCLQNLMQSGFRGKGN